MFEREKFKARMISDKCYREVCKIERLVKKVINGEFPFSRFVSLAKKGIAKNGHDASIVDRIIAMESNRVGFSGSRLLNADFGFSRGVSVFRPVNIFSGRLPASNRVVADRRFRLFSNFFFKLPRFSFFRNGKKGGV